MPTFTIHQRGTIRGVPRVGAKRQFLPGDTYIPDNGEELAILRGRPDYVASENPEEDGVDETAVPVEPEVIEPPEPTELEIAQNKQAVKDELITTSQRELWEREFPDGSSYKSVWKHGMKKMEFVEKILEKLNA